MEIIVKKIVVGVIEVNNNLITKGKLEKQKDLL